MALNGTGYGTGVASSLNYAESYGRELSQAYPYVLNFGALYASASNGKYRWVNAKTIEIPHISTTGRVDADRDTLGAAVRNYDNSWCTLSLSHQRKWSTLVHPMDIDQTNMTTTIANITKVFNEERKFPEMDAYLISTLYTKWKAGKTENSVVIDPARTADSTTLLTDGKLDADKIIATFDKFMLAMDNEQVPEQGRILYVTNEVFSALKNASKLTRTFDVRSGNSAVNREIHSLDGVQVVKVAKQLMQTAYNFTNGWATVNTADQINMLLIRPESVLTPVSYTFANLESPSALSEGKYVYYEEAFEDVFIVPRRSCGLQFHITPHAE